MSSTSLSKLIGIRASEPGNQKIVTSKSCFKKDISLLKRIPWASLVTSYAIKFASFAFVIVHLFLFYFEFNQLVLHVILCSKISVVITNSNKFHQIIYLPVIPKFMSMLLHNLKDNLSSLLYFRQVVFKL